MSQEMLQLTHSLMISASAPRCLMISSQVHGPVSLQSMNTRPMAKCCKAVKTICGRKLVKAQGIAPIIRDEVVCSLDNNSSWYISYDKQQDRVFKHQGPYRVFRLLSVSVVTIVACNCAYILGFVSLVIETFLVCLNHCKI